jgi:hypothetical protein
MNTMTLQSLLEEQIKIIKSWLPAIEYLTSKPDESFNFKKWESGVTFDEDMFDNLKILPDSLYLNYLDGRCGCWDTVETYLPISEIEKFMRNRVEYIEEEQKLAEEKERIQSRISELYEMVKSYKKENNEIRKKINAFKLIGLDDPTNQLTSSKILEIIEKENKNLKENEIEIESIEKEIEDFKEYLKTL